MTEPAPDRRTGFAPSRLIDSPKTELLPVILPTAPPPKRHFLPIGKIFLSTVVLLSVTAGVMLARIAPLTAFDWAGLLRGRDFKEVLIEGFGRKLDRPYQILVMGVDRVLDAPPGSPEVFNGRSDTMLLIRFAPDAPNAPPHQQDRLINVLSIPRDTQVWLPKFGTVKINAANVYGGAALATATVSETLQGVRIDRYVRIDTAGLVALVDALGGVEINVPKRMRYVDRTQNLDIDLYPGLQVLNGKQAEGFARFRHDEEGDIGRIRRQQILVNAVKAKFTNPMVVLRLPELIGIMKSYIDTNLSSDEIEAIATFSLSLNAKQLHTATLAGRPSDPYEFDALYWITDPDSVAKAIDGKFRAGNESTRSSP